MMMSIVELATWATIVAILYVILSNRLLAFGGAHRTIVIELGARLIEDPKAPEDLKQTVRHSIRFATSSRAAWIFAACVIPITFQVLRTIPRDQRRERRLRPAGLDHRPHHWDTWTAYAQALAIATLCNSPGALVLYYAQITVASLLVWPHIVVLNLIRKAIDRFEEKHESLFVKLFHRISGSLAGG
jgi:hypothetical protein